MKFLILVLLLVQSCKKCEVVNTYDIYINDELIEKDRKISYSYTGARCWCTTEDYTSFYEKGKKYQHNRCEEYEKRD